VEHVVPHAPVVLLQYGPACVPVVQSVSLPHLPQVPAEAQYGRVELGHESVALEPLSPLHTTQVSVATSHTGVVEVHVVLDRHCSQRPVSGPVVAQRAERQTVLPEHGPSPLANPHLLSFVSHTPDTQARPPSVVVHVPPGTWIPLLTFGWQMPGPERSSHQLPAPHSASAKQLLPHAPVVVSQYGPACVPVVQSVSLAHAPHVPEEAQYGLDELGQASVALEPLSPLQTTHVSVVASHTGVAAAHVVPDTHCSQRPALGPVVAQMVERQTAAPVVPGHGPSPLA
jgi:hypothetical protein